MKKLIIGGILLLIAVIAIVNAIAFNSQKKPEQKVVQVTETTPMPSSSPVPTPTASSYLTPPQTVKGLDSFLTLKSLGDVGDGIALEGKNSDSGTRVRVVTDSSTPDKVRTVYVWAPASKSDEAANRISFSILKTVAANVSPDSVNWLETSYTSVLKDPTKSESQSFGNVDLSVNYADVTGQLTYRADIKQ